MLNIVILSIALTLVTPLSNRAAHIDRLPLHAMKKHSDYTTSLTVAPDSTIDLINFSNMQYYTSFAVGTPGQQLTVVLDTGSTVLWIPSTNCTDCHKAKQYDPKKSSTAQMSSKVDELVYGKGKCTGFYGTETVTMGSVAVSKMPMMFVYDNTDFQNFMADGLMGLSNDKVNNIFDIAYGKQQLASPIFAFELSSQGSARPSSFYYNVTLSDFPSATFVKCTRSNYWTIPITQLRIQNNTIPVSQALIDSGTSLVVFPTATLQLIYARYFSSCTTDSTKKYKICNCKANLPTFQFTTKGMKFELTPQMYLQKMFLSNNCYVLFDGIDAVPFMILGDIFMRNYITIFDKKNNAVGIQGNIVQMDTFINNRTNFYEVNTIILAVMGTIMVTILTFLVVKGKRAQKRIGESDRLITMSDMYAYYSQQ